jgi:biotin operon repressor
MKKLIDFLKAADQLRGEAEYYLVNFASGIVPWFAAIIPAYFAYVHVSGILGVPWYLALVFAAVIEVLGFASISTFIEFRNLRERYAGTTVKGSVSPVVPVLSFGMYLLVIVLVNGVLSFVDKVDIGILYTAVVAGDTQSIVTYLFEPIAISFSIFILSFMTIPGAVIVASRTTQERFLEEKGLLGRHKPKTMPEQRTVAAEAKSTPAPEPRPFKPSAKHRKFLAALRQDKNALKNMSAFAESLGVSRTTVYNYDNILREHGYYKKTPNDMVYDIQDG